MKELSITLANLYKIYGINGVHEKLMIFCNDNTSMIKYVSFKLFTKYLSMSIENIRNEEREVTPVGTGLHFKLNLKRYLCNCIKTRYDMISSTSI